MGNNAAKGLSGLIENFLNEYFVAHEDVLPAKGLYDRIIREVEKPLLIVMLKQVNCNQKKAAEILGINRNTLRKKLDELKIDIGKL